LVFFNFGGQVLTNFAGFIIPGYYSLDALFSSSKVDDTQWLTVSLSTTPPSFEDKELTFDIVLGCLRFLDVRTSHPMP